MKHKPPSYHVYSASCSWHGDISKVGKTKPEGKPIFIKGVSIPIPPVSLPCCPHCGSMLFQVETQKWYNEAVKAEKARPNYQAFLKWTEKQPRCWLNNSLAAEAYNASPESHRKEYVHRTFDHK